MDTTADILIAGGGLTGGALALALRDSGLSVMLLDARQNDAPMKDERVLALGAAAQAALTALGVWSRMPAGAAQPVAEVRICQQTGGGLTRLMAKDAGTETLGAIVSMTALQSAVDAALREETDRTDITTGAENKKMLSHHFAVRLQESVANASGVTVTLSNGAQVRSALLVVADGGGTMLPKIAGNKSMGATTIEKKESDRIRYDYKQRAILARLHCRPVRRDDAIQPLAYEYFTESGPLALLPYHDASGASYRLVWTVGEKQADIFSAMSDTEFCAMLNTVFGRICRETGIVIRTTDRVAVPLHLDYAKTTTGVRSVLIGNAAQRLHPVGAQGFNLGLRDVMALSRTVQGIKDLSMLGSEQFFDHYADERRKDSRFTIGFTHLMAIGAAFDTFAMRPFRMFALEVLDLGLPLRKRVARTLIYGQQ